MINRRVATVIAGVAGALAVLLAIVLLVAWRMDERRDRARERAQMDMLMMRERDVALARRADDGIDWAEVTAAFGGADPPPRGDVAEFTPVFEELGRALDRDDPVAVNALCDLDRLIDEVLRVSGERWADNPNATRFDLQREFEGGVARWLVNNRGLRWKRTEIRRVQYTADGSEAVVYALHRGKPGESFKKQWWLIKRNDGWKVFDTSDLYLATRLTRDPTVAGAPEVAVADAIQPGSYAAARDAISGVTRMMNEFWDPDAAHRALEPARGVSLAPGDAAILTLLDARILARRGDVDGALGKFDEAQLLVPNMPAALSFRALALLDAGRYADALATVDEFDKLAGPDGHSLLTRGCALEGLGRRAEAAVAFRDASDDDADDVNALAGLARVLPNDQKREVIDRFAKTAEPRKAYDVLIGQALRTDDEPFAGLLLDAFRKRKPDDPRGIADDIRRKVKAEKFAEALDLLKRGLKAKEEPARDAVLFAYLHAMVGADKALEAYAAVPAAHAVRAFRALAEDLNDEIAPEGDDAAKYVRQLTDLVAAHRERVPNDPWAWFYEAEVCWHAKDYAKAEKLLAAGAAKLPPRKPEPGEVDGRDWDADQFRERRVDCLFKLKKGQTAYTDVGPVELTFRQLAALYDEANDLQGLNELLTWHRGRVPDDPEIVYWQAHVHFRRDNLAVAIPLFKSYLRDAGEKGVRIWMARDELIRALARTRPADAARMVRDLGAEPVNAALRAAVAAAAGDREELERLLAESARTGKTWFYSDADFRRFIDQEKYRDLRAKYPNPNPPKVNG